MKRILTILTLLLCLTANAQTAKNLGADISLLLRYEEYNTPYYTSAGTKIPDVITYLRDNASMNSVRVRLFVNPTNAKKDGTFQDLAYVTKFGKRIKDAGMQFLLDIHYSDTWADPDNQTIPSSWKDTSNAALTDSMYTYTKRVLEHLDTNGATPDFIQIGNEISYGMLWRNSSDRCYSNSSASTWKRFTNFLSSAAKAVREVTPKAKIILHIERSGDKDASVKFFNTMKTNGVDYDIIGLSYYPFWHKSLSTLSTTLAALETNFPDKEIQIVETAYYYNYFPTTEKSYENTTSTWKDSSAGQQAFVEDLIKTLNQHSHVTGLYYWCAEENGNGGTSYNSSKLVITTWINRGLWDNSTHKALPALFSLKKFNGDNAMGIAPLSASLQSSDDIFSIQGFRVNSDALNGIYIKGGKKYVK